MVTTCKPGRGQTVESFCGTRDEEERDRLSGQSLCTILFIFILGTCMHYHYPSPRHQRRTLYSEDHLFSRNKAVHVDYFYSIVHLFFKSQWWKTILKCSPGVLRHKHSHHRPTTNTVADQNVTVVTARLSFKCWFAAILKWNLLNVFQHNVD